MKLLIQLLSEQILPNAIACSLIKPDRVLCLDTGRFSEHAARLENISGLRHELIKAAPLDLPANVTAIQKLLDQHQQDDVWINFTGGTKMMALAAVVLGAAKPNCRCVYVDTASRRLVQIDRQLNTTFPNLGDPDLSSEEIIGLAGEEVVPDPGQDDTAPRAELTLAMARTPAAWKLTQAAAEKLPRRLGEPYPVTGNLTASPCTATWQDTTMTVVLPGKRFANLYHTSPLAYLAGGWREEYAAECLARNPSFRQVRRNLKLAWSETTRRATQARFDFTKNELDVVALFGWQPVLLECKSATYGADTLHKLKFLRDHLFGDFGVPILVAGAAPRADISEKARDQGIHIIAASGLARLADNVVACCKASEPQCFV